MNWQAILFSLNFWSVFKQILGALLCLFILWMCWNFVNKFLLPDPPKPKEVVVGEVAKVMSSNTFAIGSGFWGYKYVRLYGVGVVDTSSPIGSEGKAFLEKLVKGKEVFCTVYNEEGKYKVAAVRNSDNRDVNYELVYAGYAWLTTKEFQEWNKAQKKAQDEGKGVWANKKIMNVLLNRD